MAGIGTKQIIAIVLSIGLVVLLIFAPRHSGDVVADASEAVSDNEPPTVENQIDSALAIIAGETPMQGILLLRQIAEEHPENFRAQYNLGRFSAQTAQWDKVVERFEQVQKIDPEFAEANYWLGMAKINLDKDFEAKAHLEAFLEQERSNEELIEEARKMLNQIQ